MTLEPIIILMADDDVEDQLFVKKAFKEARVINNVVFINDGEELMRYLHREGTFADAVCPYLLLLDLNMPRKDGWEALREIRNDPNLSHIPIVILTTSDAEEDIVRSYRLGANSYVQKPVTFDKMVELIECLGRYWLGVVKLPPNSAQPET